MPREATREDISEVIAGFVNAANRDRFRFNVAETDLVFGSNVWEVVEKTLLVHTSSDGVY